MSCCPSVPSQNKLSAIQFNTNTLESDILLGESIDCYISRSGNLTGQHDDATLNVPNKIENNIITIIRTNTGVSVNTKFKLTSNSTEIASIWEIEDASDTEVPFNSTDLSLNNDTLTGNFSSICLGKKIKIVVSCKNGLNNVIDARGFTICPTQENNIANKIQLISPLPGAIINSKFGLRLHPIYNTMKPHTGIDMKYEDRSVKNVVAACDGKVLLTGGVPTSGYGLKVWIAHYDSNKNHVCTTTYNHLNKIYVTEGQNVMAGQSIGLEGTTGASTGNHLHFECKLPNGQFIDPVPLFRDAIKIADSTTLNGDANNTVIQQPTGASLTAKEASLRQNNCNAFGPSYSPMAPPIGTLPPDSSNFDIAWYFTMKHEVGPHWMTSPNYSPGDSELDNGLIETVEQRKKTGYVNTPNFPGGETKFGIAQKPNPQINVKSITYSSAKQYAFNNYWQNKCPSHHKKIAIIIFDMNYLHGPGNSNKIILNSNLPNTTINISDENIIKEYCNLLTEKRLEFIKQIPNYTRFSGWITRSNECLQYSLSIISSNNQ